MANVVGIFAHADDETLGCGGTLAKHAEAGDKIRVLVLSVDGRLAEFEAAAKVLGFTANSDGLEAWDQRFDVLGVKHHADLIAEWDLRGDVVYTHHPEDLNADHAIVARAVLTAFRPKPGTLPMRIMACEVGSSTEWTFPQAFQPNWFEALSMDQVAKKMKALACYVTEIKGSEHPRSAEGIRRSVEYRGQQCGTDFAEAFQLLRAGPF